MPKSIETLLELALATAKSNTVSPLKSPTATENGLIPTPKLVAVPNNEPVPVPKSIETLAEPWLATAKSNIVSPLKSPTATEHGQSTAKLVAVPNEPVPVPKSIEMLLERYPS